MQSQTETGFARVPRREAGGCSGGVFETQAAQGFVPRWRTSAEARAEAGKFLKDIDIHVA
ncbi:hypothetical protein [Parapedobacter sp.]